jgi:hypothetical protein
MFWMVFPSIIRSSRLYIWYQVYVIQVCWLHASGNMSVSMQSTNLYDIYLMLYVQSWTPDDGWKDHPKHVEWYWVNSKNCASSWFCYRNISQCTVPWTSNLLTPLLHPCSPWTFSFLKSEGKGGNDKKKWYAVSIWDIWKLPSFLFKVSLFYDAVSNSKTVRHWIIG